MKCTSIKKRRTKPRRGPMRDAQYRRWLRIQHCSVNKGRVPVPMGAGETIFCCRNYGVDPAHTENNGMGSKGPDSSCAPLCWKHHREYDAGRAAFEKKYGVDMKEIARQYYERYEQEKAS